MKHPYRFQRFDWVRDMWTRWTWCFRNGHKAGKNIPYCLNCGKDTR